MAPNRKTLSIVMATYNGSKYLDQQLRSLSIQTVPPDEIIISDDNSDDNTLAIIDEFRQKSSFPVKIIRRVPRLGFRENFMRASLETRGDFIAFCDQDDIWREDKIEKCSKYFDDQSISVIVHPAKTIDGLSRVIGEFRQNISKTRIKPPLSYDVWSTFWGFSIVYRRELLDLFPAESRFLDYICPEHLIAHDRWITFIGQMVGATVEIDECLVEYRQHGGNLFGQGIGSKFRITNDLKRRTELYIEIAIHMLFISHNLHVEHTKKFPLYDKAKCVDFVERALMRLQAREKIYLAENRTKSCRYIFTALVNGMYKGGNDNKMRWKSLGRDLNFVVLQR